jgi:hypothetical protein
MRKVLRGQKKFAEHYKEVKGEEMGNYWGSIYFYSAMQHFKQAVEKAGTLDQKKIRDIMAKEKFDTAGVLRASRKMVKKRPPTQVQPQPPESKTEGTLELKGNKEKQSIVKEQMASMERRKKTLIGVARQIAGYRKSSNAQIEAIEEEREILSQRIRDLEQTLELVQQAELNRKELDTVVQRSVSDQGELRDNGRGVEEEEEPEEPEDDRGDPCKAVRSKADDTAYPTLLRVLPKKDGCPHSQRGGDDQGHSCQGNGPDDG